MISSLCFLFFCFLKCVPTQANNAYVRDQWYHSIIWKVLVNFPLIGFLRATLMNFLFLFHIEKSISLSSNHEEDNQTGSVT